MFLFIWFYYVMFLVGTFYTLIFVKRWNCAVIRIGKMIFRPTKKVTMILQIILLIFLTINCLTLQLFNQNEHHLVELFLICRFIKCLTDLFNIKLATEWSWSISGRSETITTKNRWINWSLNWLSAVLKHIYSYWMKRPKSIVYYSDGIGISDKKFWKSLNSIK